MDAAVVVAVIALVGALANVGVTYWLNVRSEKRRAAEKSELMWSQYRASLGVAAFELSARIENILQHRFLDAYGHGGAEVQKDEAILGTLFRFAQYFGWGEIIRRSARAPDPRHAAEARALGAAVDEVARRFSTDMYGAGAFMVWREAQRAIGEVMIRRDGEVIDTLGVVGFVAEWESLRPWLHRMRRLLDTTPPADWDEGERSRLDAVESGLKDIVEMTSA